MGVFVILKYIEILSEIRKSVNPVTFIFKLLGIKQWNPHVSLHQVLVYELFNLNL